MTLGVGRCRFGLALLATLLACSAAAVSGPGAGGSIGPGVTPLDLKADLARVPELVSPEELWDRSYEHLKILGMSHEEAGPLLDELQARAEQGEVADDVIQRASWLILERPLAQKAMWVLRRHAETLVHGSPLAGADAPLLQLDLSDAASADFPLKGDGSREGALQGMSADADAGLGIEWEDGREEGYDELVNGGPCLACPSFDFGCFTPTCTPAFHSATLATPGTTDCAWYCFSVVNGETYTFDTCATGGAGGTDTILRLRNTACALLASNDSSTLNCGVGNQGSFIQYTATFTGTVRLQVQRFNSATYPSGFYTLQYKKTVPCAAPCTESCAAPGGTFGAVTTACTCVSGSTSAATCPARFYSATLQSGKTYRFSACSSQSCSSSAFAGFDAALKLWGPGCTGPVATADDTAGCGLQPAITYTVPPSPSGTFTYVLEVGSVTGGFGNFTVCAEDVACSTCADPSPFPTLVATTSCQITPTACVDSCQDNYYQMMMNAGVSYTFSTTGAATGCSPACVGSANFDSVIEIRDPVNCNVVLASNDDCGSSTGSYIASFVPAVGGLHKILVRDFFGASGGCYNLAYKLGCTPPSTVTITPPGGAFTTNPNDCKKTQTFLVGANGDLPTTFTFSVSSSGGSAAPSTGTFVEADGQGQVTIVFTKAACGTASYQLTVTATNACGSKSQTVNISLSDTTPPVVTPPANTTVDCKAVPPPGTPTATDNCDPNPSITYLGETVIPGPNPTCQGNYTILRRWRATDCNGNQSAIATQVIVVLDTTPPDITFSDATIACLWSPNHDYLCIDMSSIPFTVTDDCSTITQVALAGVMSSECDNGPCDTTEGNGDGNFTQDVCPVPSEIIGQSYFCVRAERMGTGVGRYYTVFITAADGCGNTSAPTSIGKIFVPHDSNEHPECIPANDDKTCSEVVCDNGIDGDMDGLVDCADPDCVGQPGCL